MGRCRIVNARGWLQGYGPIAPTTRHTNGSSSRVKPMANAAHHSTPAYLNARRWIQGHVSDPLTLCQRCGKVAAQHGPQRSGRAQHWQAGHSIAGSMTWRLWTDVTSIAPDGDWLWPEMSRCNVAASNQQRVSVGNALGL